MTVNATPAKLKKTSVWLKNTSADPEARVRIQGIIKQTVYLYINCS